MGLTVIKTRQHSLIREEEEENQNNYPHCGYLKFVMTVVTAL